MVRVPEKLEKEDHPAEFLWTVAKLMDIAEDRHLRQTDIQTTEK